MEVNKLYVNCVRMYPGGLSRNGIDYSKDIEIEFSGQMPDGTECRWFKSEAYENDPELKHAVLSFIAFLIGHYYGSGETLSGEEEN